MDAIRVKHGSDNIIDFIYTENGIQGAIPGVPIFKISIKAAGKYDSAPLTSALSSAFETIGSGSEIRYRCRINVNVLAVRTALGIDSDDTNDIPEFEAHADLRWVSEGRTTITRTFRVLIENNVTRDEDSSPPPDEIPNWPEPSTVLTTDDFDDTASGRGVPKIDPTTGKIAAYLLPAALTGSIRVDDEPGRLALTATDGTLVFQADNGSLFRLNGSNAAEANSWEVVAITAVSRSSISDFGHANTHFSGGSDELKLSDLAPASGWANSLHANANRSGLVPPTPAGTKTLISASGALQWGDPSAINAFSETSGSFVQPASGATVNVALYDSRWLAIGSVIYIETGGFYEVTNIIDAANVTAKNLGYPVNAIPGATVAANKRVVAAGLIGPQGIQGVPGANGTNGTNGADGLNGSNGTNGIDGTPLASNVAGLALTANGTAGTSNAAARADHTHPFPTPDNIGALANTANAATISASERLLLNDAYTSNTTVSANNLQRIMASNSANAIVFSLPDDANLSASIGSQFMVLRANTGNLAIQTANSVSLIYTGVASTSQANVATIGSLACFTKLAANRWHGAGDLS